LTPFDLPEVKVYLRLIEGCRGCDTLVAAENEAFRAVTSNADTIDWADAAGTDELHDYWLAADTADLQSQLGMICHVRAHAWHAVWRQYL
jgi:hypothetical protein